MKHVVQVRAAGVVSYAEGLEMQKKACNQVEEGCCDGVLLLLQHLPVVTAGRGGGRENLVVSLAGLQAAGVVFVEAGRGGNITCHNPGQLVGYPILNLSRWQEDVHWYVRQLEEVLIRTLAGFGVVAGRKARYTGVWVENQKIAAVGVSFRRWISGHGFALNVSNDLDLFQSIVPCGIGEFGVISLEKLGVMASLPGVAERLVAEFATVFDATTDFEQEG